MNFITGNNFKNISHYILDETGFRKNVETKGISTYFVKTDYVNDFFYSSLLPKSEFKLITHNSDFSINKKHALYLEYKFLKTWFAQNVDFQHNKLIPIPIGIANEQWPHGDTKILQYVIDQNYHKTQLIYANFNIKTNPQNRNYCIKYISSEYIENNVSFEIYLKHTAQSYFTICPLGNGIDSHRIWESLYLKSIPIAENTYNIRQLKTKYNLPIILIDDWSNLPALELNLNVYHNMIKNLDISKLTVENFINEDRHSEW